MQKFEIKKFFKSKKAIFLLMFSIIISFYGFFFSSHTDLVLSEYDMYRGEYISIDNFFSGEPAPKELKDLEIKRRYDIYGNITKEISKEEYNKLNYEKNKWMLSLLNEYKDKYPQIFSEENLDNVGNLEWSIYKYEYLYDNNASDIYYRYNLKGDNLIQRIIFSSKSIFGIIPILFFVLLFSNIFSRERESQTLNLLYSQPIDRKKIVFSKFVIIALSILLYIILALLMYLLFSLVTNTSINGDKDLYRILNSKDYLAHYTGFRLLLFTLIAFFSIGLFWSSLSLFFSTRFNSQNVVSVMLVIIAVIYSTTPYLSFMRSIFNPIYNLDIVYRLLGNFELLTNELGRTSFVLNKSHSISYYIIFLGLALLILFPSLYAFSEVKNNKSKERRRKFSNLIQFELIKIFNTNSYKIYLLGCIFLIITNFAVNLNLNQKVEKETFGDMGMFKSRYIGNIEFVNTEKKRLENILSGKDYLSYFDTEKGELVKTKDLGDDDKKRLKEEIQQYQYQIDDLNRKMSEIDKLNEAYKNKDGKIFYQLLSQIYSERWEMIKASNIKKADNLSSSINLTSKIFSQSSKDNTSPLVIVAPFYSTLDSYKDLDANKEFTRQINIYSNSGPIFLFNLFWNKNLALILVGLAALMVISGFTTDTENGIQIELMLTSSHTRKEIFSTKTLSQFLYSCLTILSIVLIIFILGFITNGINGYNLPIANYLESGFELMPLWQYLVKVIVAIIAFVLFLTCLMNTISIYTKNKLCLLAFTILVLLFAKYFTVFLPSTLKLFSPISYFRLDMLADQSIKVFENMPKANYFIGILVLVVWSIIIYFFGGLLFSKKKDLI